ncbi:MAG: hypothetical protein DWQ37_16185 [Planctomycetota bacterium]|nr:MAG: hypothetical protein DWQ37_16185 [Planctomycetota bacterium]
MNCRVFVILSLLAVVCVARPAEATPLAPTDDAFGYQFLPAFNMNSPPFGAFLPAGLTTTGHSTRSVLAFDVASLGLTSAEVVSASLDLYVISTEATTFGVSPSAANPITVNLSALGAGAWDETTVTDGSIPAVGAQYDQLTIDAINQTVSFDVTALVKDWLDGTVTNNGLILEGDTPVGGSPDWIYAVFASKDNGTVPLPQLTVVEVPEPASAWLALVALPALAWLGRRRLGAKQA